MIHRRTLIRQFVFVSAGVALIPSCMQERRKASVILKNIHITGDQEDDLADLCETIIPKTGTPGARDIGAHLFALKMLDDCYTKEDQAKFSAGLTKFESLTKSKTGGRFADAAKDAKEKLVETLNGSKSAEDETTFFYRTIKHLTIQAYTSSEFYLTKVQVYKLVPGPFKGCVPVATA